MASFWEQKSRFFNRTLQLRRVHNRISKVKDDLRNWQSEPNVTMDLIQQHFEKAFSSIQCQEIDDVLQAVDLVITDDMNSNLFKPVTCEEVKKQNYVQFGWA